MDKFQGRFRIASTRLKDWDYSSAGWYFVTICTRNQKPFFGEVFEDKVELSSLGEIAIQMWREIPYHHSGVELDEFVIMPNHIHGVIILSSEEQGASQDKSVETLHATSVQSSMNEEMAEISPRKGSLSVVIRSYKSAVSRWSRRNGIEDFAWQSRYFDHVIRNEESLRKIRRYIRENPMKWALDRYYREETST
jgi:putative transposase